MSIIQRISRLCKNTPDYDSVWQELVEADDLVAQYWEDEFFKRTGIKVSRRIKIQPTPSRYILINQANMQLDFESICGIDILDCTDKGHTVKMVWDYGTAQLGLMHSSSPNLHSKSAIPFEVFASKVDSYNHIRHLVHQHLEKLHHYEAQESRRQTDRYWRDRKYRERWGRDPSEILEV